MSSWDLVWERLPVEIVGLIDHHHRRITLDPRQTQAERRSTIAHELVHAERGPAPRCPWWEAREERITDAVAARRLIGLHQLGEALAWSSDLDEVADELWVDVPTVEARLAHLRPGELRYLTRRLEEE